MFLLSEHGRAISFNDESSPDSRQTDKTKVCIDGQVNRGLSLDWFFKVLALFPDTRDELKSAVMVGKFNDLPASTRESLWRSLRKVRIHIVDPRPHFRRMDDILSDAWKDDNAPDTLRRMATEGLPHARLVLAKAREFIAQMLLDDSAAVRVQTIGRVFRDTLPTIRLDDYSANAAFAEHSQPLLTLEDFGRVGKSDIVRDVASWSAKASAAFHPAIDAALLPDENDAATYRYDLGRHVRRRMAQELIPPHAFDKGNTPHIVLLEKTRRVMIDDLAANERFYRVIGQPGFVELESKESYYIQAADFAAGLACGIFASQRLLGVVERFEYVTYNGAQVSYADAGEIDKSNTI